MIRIWRGEEPAELAQIRDARSAAAELSYLATGQRPSVDGYQYARNVLFERQNHKCAWCERDECDEGQPVEHYRPKGRANRCWPRCNPAQRLSQCIHGSCQRPEDDLRYFWLGWTWENLLFGCVSCNSQEVKGNHFPLVPGSLNLPILAQDLAAEQRLLIDPAADNPRHHIRFRWEERLESWRPYALTEIGRWTLEVIGLSWRDAILSAFDEHVTDLDGIREELRGHMAAGDEGGLRACWQRWMTRLFRPRKRFHSLTFDYFEHHFSQALRDEWGLFSPPEPGDVREVIPSQPLARPEVDGLPHQLRLQVRALGHRAELDELRTCIREVCRLEARTLDDLATMLRRSRAHLREVTRAMVEAAELEHDGARWRAPA